MFFREYHPTRDLQEFIKSIIETKSKAEEDRIIKYTLKTLKDQIKSKKVSDAKRTEYAIKAIYSEMLGQEASFSYVFLIKMIESKSLMVKKVGYLACSLMLHNSPDLRILLVQSLLKDINNGLNPKSKISEVLAALNALPKLLSDSFAPAFLEPLKKLLSSKHPLVKKKALIALQRVAQLTEVPNLSAIIGALLADASPPILAVCLNIIKDFCVESPEEYLPLVPKLSFLLTQIYEKKAGYYDYQKMPEPFMQIKILEIFRVLVAGDKQISGELYPAIEKTLMRADSVNTDMSFGLVYECVLTICSLYPNKILLRQASKAVSKFLSTHSNNSNLTYMGIKALRHLALKDSELIADHQVFVVRCLESNDDSMKRITLELLYKNTNSNNIDIIVNKLVQTLVSSNDKGFRQSLTDKVFDLAVRFSRSDMWFLRVVRVLILHAPEFITSSMVNSILPIFTESWTDQPQFARELVYVLANMLETTEGQPSDVLMRLFSWVVANIGVPYIRSQIPHHFQRSKQAGQADTLGPGPTTDDQGLFDDMLDISEPQTAADKPPAPNQEMDLLDLDFRAEMTSEPVDVDTQIESTPNQMENADLLGDDIDLLSGPAQPAQVNQPVPSGDMDLDLFGMDAPPAYPVAQEPQIVESIQTEAPGVNNKEVEDFLVRISTLAIGLFNWIHKSDMTKCWILDALLQIRRVLGDTGGFQDYLAEIQSVLEKDTNHSNFEVRLRVREALEFDVNIQSLSKSLTPDDEDSGVEYDPNLEFLFPWVESTEGVNYCLEKSEELNGSRADNKKVAVLNFKRYELMTKATKPNIDLGFNSKPKAKEKVNILEEVETEEAIEVESEDIILDTGADKGMWTMTGYQGAPSGETDSKGVKGVIISHAEKKKEKTLFSGFDVKKKKKPSKPVQSTTIVNSSQTNKILTSGGLGSEDIFPKGKPRHQKSDRKTPVKQVILEEEQKKKMEREKKERALASDLFSGMKSRTKLKKEAMAKPKKNPFGSLYQVRPKHMTLADYQEVWEDLEHKIEDEKECSSLVTVKWLKGVITNGLKFGIVSEENEDIIAAGEERNVLICLYATFDSDDNTVEYTIATNDEKIGKKVKNRMDTLLK